MNIFKKIKLALSAYELSVEADKMIDRLYDNIYTMSIECKQLRKENENIMSIFRFLIGEEVYYICDSECMPDIANKFVVNVPFTFYLGTYRIYRFTAYSYIINKFHSDIELLVKEIDYNRYKFSINMNDTSTVFKDMDSAVEYAKK